MFSLLGFHVFPLGVSCFPLSRRASIAVRLQEDVGTTEILHARRNTPVMDNEEQTKWQEVIKPEACARLGAEPPIL